MIGIYEIERIYSVNGTLTVTRSDNQRDTRCAFKTYDAISEWDEIIIEDDYGVRLFAGILESPEIDKTDNNVLYGAEFRGYKKLFDRLKVEEAYEDELAGDIVRTIVSDFCPGFTSNAVEDGTTISKVVYNYVLPSEGIDRIARSIGYRWNIDAYKDVQFTDTDATPATREITADESYYRNLRLSPDTSNLCNVVIVRGGTYLSEQVSYEEKGDGAKTQFVLPEKPHDVEVYVNGVQKTVGIKFGEVAASEEFQINFNEKYVENGTYAVLTSSDTLEVLFTYDVPIRVRRRNLASIAALQALFPETDGTFEKVIHDKEISTRALAYETAQQHLDAYANAVIDGSFDTVDDIFEPGEILTINVPEYTGNAVVQSIQSKHIAGSLWRHTVRFATVLFGFQEFLRELLAAKKVELIDGETLETSTEVSDEFSVTDSLTATIDGNRQTEDGTIDDDLFADINISKSFVLGPYFPANHAASKRVFNLDLSPLG